MQFPHISVALANDEFAKYRVGGIYEAPEGRLYRYAQTDDSNLTLPIPVGAVCGYAWNGASDDWVVTNGAAAAIDSSLATVNIVAGVAVCEVDGGYFSFFQISGLCSDVTTDYGVARGDNLVVDGANSPTGVADTAVAGEEHAVFGLALADDADDSVDAILRRIV